MKKLILCLFTILLQLNASTELQLKYQEGLAYYKAKDFSKSYALFSQIYLQKLSDVNFNYYFAKSAYETGHYETALAAYERVEIQDNTNIQNKLEMAKTFYRLKMYQDSKSIFTNLLKNPTLPVQVQKNIQLSLEKISKKEQRSFTNLTFAIDSVYDSNVNYGSFADYDYGGRTLQKIDSNTDSAIQSYLSLVNVYDIGKKNGFALKNSFSLYNMDYKLYDDYDVLFLAYSPSILYQGNNYSLEATLGIDNVTLNKEKYLSSIHFMQNMSYQHSPIFSSYAHIKFKIKKFQQEIQKELDATRYEIAYGFKFNSLRMNLVAMRERKLQGTNIYVDYDEFKWNNYYSNNYFDFSSTMRQRNYKDFSYGFNSNRKDLAYFGDISTIMDITKSLQLKLAITYEYVNSNQDRFSSKKHTTSVGLIQTF